MANRQPCLACPGGPFGENKFMLLQKLEIAMLRSGCLNSDLSPDLLDEYAPLTTAAAALLRYHLERGRLSGRGYHRIRRVARTIADLQDASDHCSNNICEQIDEAHVATALALRVGVHPQLSGDRL